MNLLLILVVSTWCIASGEVHQVRYDTKVSSGHILEEGNKPQLCNGNQRKIDSIEKISENEVSTGLKIFKAVAHQNKGFFAVSVWDAFIALSTLKHGAEGRSLQQLNNVFGYSGDCSGIREDKLQRVVDRINDPDLSDASMETQIFHSPKSALKETFMEDMRRYFQLSTKTAPLKDLVDGTAIYNWADSININYENIPTRSNVDEESLVIATAAVFRSNFIFDRSSACSKNGHFRYNNVHEVDNFEYVRFSTVLNYGEFNYRSKNGDVKAHYIVLQWTPIDDSLPQDKIRTVLVAPLNNADIPELGPNNADITELEEYISPNVIQKLIPNSARHPVIATLPKELTIESSYTLDNVLKDQLNLTEMSKKTNDFAKITKTGAMKVGPIYHQVQVDQEWEGDYKPCESNATPNGKDQKIFNANRAFLIFNVFIDEGVFLLSAGRYGWAPGVKNADEGLFARKQ